MELGANTTLPAAVREEIVAAYLAGAKGPDLAAKYGVSFVSVYNYMRRAGHKIRPPMVAARRHALDATVFDVLTPESAYWLGVLMTDGCVRLKPNPTLQYGAAEVDRSHVETFRAFLKSEHPICVRPARLQRICGRMCNATAYHSVVVPSIPLVNAVIRWGVVPGKTYSADVDARLVDSRDFWRGAIDGDGTFGMSGGEAHISLVSAGRLAHRFEEFVRRQHPPLRAVTRRAKGRLFVFTTNTNIALKIISLLYADTKTALPRKANLARSMMRSF